MNVMTHRQTCSRPFAEELFSGYLDGSLPQQRAQHVRLHLEDCPRCNALYEEMKELREATLSTTFRVPPDDVWPELPTTPGSRWTRSLGWIVTLVWLIAVLIIALWRFASQAGDPLEIFLVLGLPGGFALLFLSVALDRFRDLKTDRYRGVKR